MEAAERLLSAVADGASESVDLARALVGAVLDAPQVKDAIALERLIREGSALALVRAVELAGLVLQGGTDAATAAAAPGTAEM